MPREKGQVAVRNLGEHQFKLATVGSVEHSQFVRLVLWAMDGPPVIELIDGHGRIRYLALVRKRVQLRPSCGPAPTAAPSMLTGPSPTKSTYARGTPSHSAF